MRILAGIQQPTSGRVELDAPPRVRVRMVPQELSRVSWLSASEYVTYTLYLAGISRAPAAKDVLADVGLGGVADTAVHRLSGGELRRLAIGAAIAARAQVLLLDEPTAGLDPLQRESVHALIRAKREQCTILVSSHVSDDIEQLVDSIAVLGGGEIRYLGSVDDLTVLTAEEQGDSVITRALRWADRVGEASEVKR